MSDTQCAQEGQLVVVAHDLSRLATLKGGGLLLGGFTAWVPAWDAHICFCHCGRDRNGSEWMGPPEYRWTTPEGEERYPPVVTFGSIAYRAVLRAVQKLGEQAPAR